jgi:uncharacterized protein YceK
MKKLALVMALCALSGCASGSLAPKSSAGEKAATVAAASQAVAAGRYEQAETLLSDYVYRTEDSSLKLRVLALTGETQKQAIHTVASLLWETGRDATLSNFASDYLPRHDRNVVLCRLAERQARYQDAYRCWNDLGYIDRAERVIRTQAAIEVLGI